MGLEMKLKNRFKFLPFVASSYTDYEPFLSRHRQTVCLDIIKRNIDLEKYIKNGSILSEVKKIYRNPLDLFFKISF